MQIEFQTPTVVEGDWYLIASDGKVLARAIENQGAVLVIEPYFYKGAYSQILARTKTVGKRGKEVRNALRVGAQTGKITAELASTLPAKIVPKFDTQAKEAKSEEHKK